MAGAAAGAAALAVAKGITVTVASGLILGGLTVFANHFNGAHEVWHCGPDEASRELDLLNKRSGDQFPQGYDKCRDFLRMCRDKRWRFQIKAIHTRPWTWYYETD